MVDGWDMIQRPLVWHPGASAMSAVPGSPPFLPPPPSRYTPIGHWVCSACSALVSILSLQSIKLRINLNVPCIRGCIMFLPLHQHHGKKPRGQVRLQRIRLAHGMTYSCWLSGLVCAQICHSILIRIYRLMACWMRRQQYSEFLMHKLGSHKPGNVLKWERAMFTVSNSASCRCPFIAAMLEKTSGQFCIGHQTCDELMHASVLRRPGDVLNWERAMFTDSNSAYLVSAPALAAAAAAAAVLPPVALRQLLSPFSRRTQ